MLARIAQARPMPDEQLIAHYKVIGMLGAGGMGGGYRATDKKRDREVASKCYWNPSTATKTLERLQRFSRSGIHD